MKRLMANCLYLLLFCLLFSSCYTEEKPLDPYRHINDPEVREILIHAMEKAGGLEAWKSKESLIFEKIVTLYDENGAVEKSVVEQHEYLYQPDELIRITWEQDSVFHQISYQQGEVNKIINDQIDENADGEVLRNTVLSATYVVSLPFKLLDEGVQLTYEGIDTLEDQHIVKVLKGVFYPEKYANHSSPDIWWYYFDGEDYRLVAYMVKHADHISYVKNEEYMMLNSFLFPRVRKSYRIDEQGKILFLRAAYTYDARDWDN